MLRRLYDMSTLQFLEEGKDFRVAVSKVSELPDRMPIFIHLNPLFYKSIFLCIRISQGVISTRATVWLVLH